MPRKSPEKVAALKAAQTKQSNSREANESLRNIKPENVSLDDLLHVISNIKASEITPRIKEILEDHMVVTETERFVYSIPEGTNPITLNQSTTEFLIRLIIDKINTLDEFTKFLKSHPENSKSKTSIDRFDGLKKGLREKLRSDNHSSLEDEIVALYTEPDHSKLESLQTLANNIPEAFYLHEFIGTILSKNSAQITRAMAERTSFSFIASQTLNHVLKALKLK